MIKLITDEGTFEYTDLVELIHEYDKNTLDMNVPSNEATVFKVKGGVTYLIDVKFSEFMKELKWDYEFIMGNVSKRLFMELGYGKVLE